MAAKNREPGFATLCIHGKKHLDKHEGEKPIRAVSTPIFQSSTFAFENAEHGAAVFRAADICARVASSDRRITANVRSSRSRTSNMLSFATPSASYAAVRSRRPTTGWS